MSRELTRLRAFVYLSYAFVFADWKDWCKAKMDWGAAWKAHHNRKYEAWQDYTCRAISERYFGNRIAD